MCSWIDFLQQCGLTYVKYFLPATTEGGRLELEKSPKITQQIWSFQH